MSLTKKIRNTALVLTAIGASIFIGSQLGISKVNLQNTQNTSYVSDSNLNKQAKRETRKNLEDYFIQDREITNITRYSTDTIDPSIIDIKTLDQEERQEYESNKIVRLGLREYVLPGTEDSPEKILALRVLEFESSQATKEFLEKNKEEITYPIFVKDNVVSLIEKVTTEETNPQGPFSEEQQTMYLNSLSDYAAKKGMEIISNGNQIEKMNMYETNPNSASENAPAQNDDLATRQARDAINQIANAITEVNSRKDNSINGLEQKTIEVGIRVIPDIFNAEVTFYERGGKRISGNDVYTSDWKEYGYGKENGRGYGVTKTFSTTLEDKDSFVEIKAIVKDPLYPSSTIEPFETRTFREDWEVDSRVELVPIAMYHPKN